MPSNIKQNEIFLMMSHQQKNMKNQNLQKSKVNQSLNEGFYPHNHMGSNFNPNLSFYDKGIQEIYEEDENNVIFIINNKFINFYI